MIDCYQKACDNSEFITDDNLGMIVAVAYTVTRTMIAFGRDLKEDEDVDLTCCLCGKL